MSEPQNIYDRSAKVLFRERPEDFLRLALPDIDPARIRIDNPELNLPELRADEITFLDEKQAALVEFMIEPDARRLRSWFVKTAMATAALPEQEVMLLVYYMTPGGYARMPSEYAVSRGARRQVFQFETVQMWEHAPAIRAGHSRALAPFLILWSKDGVEEALAETRRLCLEEPDARVRGDMLSVAISVAQRIVKDKDWLFRYFREELQMIKSGTIIEDWIEEGVQKGLERGRQEGELRVSRRHVLDVLQTRFELVPSDVTRAIDGLSDASLLDQLLRLAVKVLDLDQFREKLKAAGATP